MLVYGQLNVFRRSEARDILVRACRALKPGGRLLLEPQRAETVEASGKASPTWYTCGDGGGLFSERPHVCLSESFWDPEGRTATHRYHVIDAQDGSVASHAMSVEAYAESDLLELLRAAGFETIRFHASLVGVPVEEWSQHANVVVVACKPS